MMIRFKTDQPDSTCSDDLLGRFKQLSHHLKVTWKTVANGNIGFVSFAIIHHLTELVLTYVNTSIAGGSSKTQDFDDELESHRPISRLGTERRFVPTRAPRASTSNGNGAGAATHQSTLTFGCAPPCALPRLISPQLTLIT